MKQKKKFHGVIVPMVTPFTESGEIDTNSVNKIVDFVINAGAFPFVLGTTGEIASISYKKRFELVKLAAQYINDRTTFYAGITDNCIDNTLKSAEDFANIGVDVLVVHLPYFFPLDNNLMKRYFEIIANSSPLPIILYNIVSITHMSLPLEIADELSHHPNIVGLKDSERDWERMKELAKLFRERDDFSIFIGWTNKSCEALEIGFDGIIPNTGNITPSLFKSLYDHVIRGEDEFAIQLQNKAESLSKLVQNNKTMAQTIPELKTIMNYMNLCDPYVLPPLAHLDSRNREILFSEFTTLDVNKISLNQ